MQKINPKNSLFGPGQNKSWLSLTVAVIIIAAAANFLWIAKHPYPIGWDETSYLNQVLKDKAAFDEHGISSLGWIFLKMDTARPPAHRIQALPTTAAMGFDPRTLRAVSYIFFLAAAGVIFLTVRKAASIPAAAITAMMFILSPQCMGACRRFLTESTLFLAIALVLYFTARAIIDRDYSWKNYLGLGIAAGLGCWTKASFLIFAGPSMLLLFIMLLFETNRKASTIFLIKAGLIAGLIAAPWWLTNFKDAIVYSQIAGTFSRHSMGEKNLTFFLKWIQVFFSRAFGIFSTTAAALIMFRLFARKKTSTPSKKSLPMFTAFCIPAALPLIIAQLLASNQNMRLIAPAFIPVFILIGVAMAKTSFTKTKTFFIVTAILMTAQLAYNTTMAFRPDPFYDQANWQKLRSLCTEHNIENPQIAILGQSPIFNPAQIIYPWRLNNQNVSATSLWTSQQKFDWTAIDKTVDNKNVVITIRDMPTQTSEYYAETGINADNKYNNELIERYSANENFIGPLKLKIASIAPLDVNVFFRKKIETENTDD